MGEVAATVGSTITSGPGGSTVVPDLNSTQGPSGVQGTGGGPVGVPSNASVNWTDTLSPEQKLYVTQKGFKDSAAILDSYQNLEKLMGVPKERLMKLPEKPDAPEWGDVYERLGKPKDSKDYTFKTPEGVNEDPSFTKWAQENFHAANLTKAQGEKLAQAWNDFALKDMQQNKEKLDAQIKSEEQALRREWGMAWDQKLKAMDKTAMTFGLDEKALLKLRGALGISSTAKFLANIGEKLGEHSFQDGNPSSFGGAMEPEMAKAEIAELKRDKSFVQKYVSGDRDAMRKMTELHKMAYPDMPQTGGW